MSNGQGQGDGKPQHDDRTLLDPLSNDELRALREARQRMQAKKEPGSAVAHQIVIGPDSGEDIGSAPTRAMPALPSFDGHASLNHISSRPEPAPQQRVTAPAPDPATIPQTPAPSTPVSRTPPPASVGPAPSDDTVTTSQADTVAMTQRPPALDVPGMPPPTGIGPAGPATGTGSLPPQSAGGGGAGGGTAPPAGFGENTLMWMQPPKASAQERHPGPRTADYILPSASKKEIALGRLKTFGAIGFVTLLIGGLLYLGLFSAPKGTIELHSTPPKADVFIDGSKYGQTPVKLTLSEGAYRISLKLDGYETSWFTANAKAEQSKRRDVALVPISRPGLMTVKIEVQPIAAKITVDGKSYESQRVLMVPNVDPLESHKILVEAQGFVKIIQEIRRDELKSSYSFVLAKAAK